VASHSTAQKRRPPSSMRRPPGSRNFIFLLLVATLFIFYCTLLLKSDTPKTPHSSFFDPEGALMQVQKNDDVPLGLVNLPGAVCIPASNDISLSLHGGNMRKSSNTMDANRCSLVSSAEPTAWGPVAWMMLHTMAANYPIAPDDAHREGCKKFLEGLPYMLPCGECGYHLLRQYEEWGTSLEQACSSRFESAPVSLAAPWCGAVHVCRDALPFRKVHLLVEVWSMYSNPCMNCNRFQFLLQSDPSKLAAVGRVPGGDAQYYQPEHWKERVDSHRGDTVVQLCQHVCHQRCGLACRNVAVKKSKLLESILYL
jgi:hypothetical protein